MNGKQIIISVVTFPVVFVIGIYILFLMFLNGYWVEEPPVTTEVVSHE
jgi:hypothetical protein